MAEDSPAVSGLGISDCQSKDKEKCAKSSALDIEVHWASHLVKGEGAECLISVRGCRGCL